MSYNYLTQYNSPNYGGIYGPLRLPCKTVTIHWWDDPAKRPSPTGVISTLCDPGRGASAHAVIWPGNVACLVDFDRAAWHSGDPTGNQTSIGLELDPCHINETIPTAAEFIADLVRKGVVARDFRLVGHRDWPQASTDCPGRYHSRLGEIAARVEAILGGTSAPSTRPAPAPAPSSSNANLEALADAVYRGEYGNGDERRRALGDKFDAVQEIVNRKYYGVNSASSSNSDDLEALADAVYRGEYGNGDERRRLGKNYDAVQAIVNKKYYGIG